MSAAKNGSGVKPAAEVKVLGKESLRGPLPKRFYKRASVANRDGGFTVLLDGKPIRTPAKKELVLPTKPLAEAIAVEWSAQGERIDPATMPLTRIANSAIDAVAGHEQEVAADIAAFAGSDLVCYRAEAPRGLVERQKARWDPLLDWARDDLGAAFARGIGVVHVAQSAETLDRVRQALAGLGPFALAALHVLTTLAGSAVIALAHARGRLDVEAAWASAHVDEDWQIENWGKDADAESRRAARLAEFTAASRMIELLG